MTNDELREAYKGDQLAQKVIDLMEIQNDDELFRGELLKLLVDIKEGKVNVD